MTKILNQFSKTRFCVSGLNLENFLYVLTSCGINLSKVKKKKKKILFVSSSINETFIKQKAAENGLVCIVEKRFGAFEFFKKIPYCFGALFGVVCSVLTLMYFTRFVYCVNFELPQNHTCSNGENCIFNDTNFQQIKLYFSNDIKAGQPLNTNLKDLQQKVMANFELVESCTISKKGTTVNISLTEAAAKQSLQPPKIVAKNNCIITKIITHSGIAKVKAGDVVKKGQVLVESDGNILPRADIMAKVWYVGTAFHNSNKQVLVETGKTTQTVSLQFLNFKFGKTPTIDYQYYQAKTQTTFVWQWFLPVKKTTTIFEELQLKEEYINFEDVKQTVLAKSKQAALDQTTGSPTECTYSIVKEGPMVRVDCYLLVEEQIGTIK